ncbi:MAG: hypothetical protein JSS49_29490 [Planctomycetes bacterium]|nr:hypothetical protein [Planctomycetota bacterium]
MFRIRSSIIVCAAAVWALGNLASAKDKDHGHAPAHKPHHTAPQQAPAHKPAAPAHVPAQSVVHPVQRTHVNPPQDPPRIHVQPQKLQVQPSQVHSVQIQPERVQPKLLQGTSQIQLTQQHGSSKTHTPGKGHVPQNTTPQHQPANPPRIHLPPHNSTNSGGLSTPGLGFQLQPKIVLPQHGTGQHGVGGQHGSGLQVGPGTNKLPQFNPQQHGNLPGLSGNPNPKGSSGSTTLVPNTPNLKTQPQHDFRHTPGRTDVPGLKHNINTGIPGLGNQVGAANGLGNLPGSTTGNHGQIRHEHLPMKVDTPIAGVQKHTIPLNIPKNGHATPLNTGNPAGANLKGSGIARNQDQLQFLLHSRDHQELRHNLEHLKQSPEFHKNPQLAHLNIDKISGLHQERLQHNQVFEHWRHTNVGQQLNLDRQFQLQRHGDLTRQMNFTTNIINSGGWQHRQHGAVAASFTSSSFSVWYAGGGCYPRHCWYPRWSPWVSWCWWDTCVPFYDPRPIYCRPIVYQPCQPWVYYNYPVWQPLPVVACGTWVDVTPVVVPAGLDLQLLAVRFVDNGHPEQNLGPRYRAWIRNNSQVQITAPFSVLALASNDPTPSADLPQAGVVIPTMDIGEIKPVDIRLPLAANRLGVTPEGHRVPFNYLHVLVDSHQQIAEFDETNNGSVVSRTDILPVDPAAFSTDQTASSPGATLTIAGEGFGPEPGRVLVSVGGQQTEALIQGWYDLGIRFTVPNYNLTGAVDADILVVRGDGAVSNPLDLELAPQGLIGPPEEFPGAPIPDAPQ